jgi:hypothetical protein
LFLLSVDEANQYFNTSNGRIATSLDEEKINWWLCSCGSNGFRVNPILHDYAAAFVRNNGSVRGNGYFANKVGGVRVALQWKLES